MHTLTAIDYKSASAGRLFAESLHETGFGVLKNHPISKDQVEKIYTHWLAFFQSDEKQAFLFDAEKYDGFFPIDNAESAKGHTVRDLKEYYHFYLWGKCPPNLRAQIADYYEKTVSFAAELLGWVEEHSPSDIKAKFNEPLSSMIENSDLSLLRVLHYPPLPDSVETGAIRANAHEDINLLTILPSANELGLQVKTREDSWLDVPCDFGNLIINCGDMLQEASGHFYPSTSHRVCNPIGADRNRSRISLPLFLHPRPQVVLSERYTAQQYREERLAELRD